MTKEEALKKIEELKAFVEKLDEEIPEMITSPNSKETAFLGLYEYGALNEYHSITFNDETDKRYYLIKAFELAHLIYAREHIKNFEITDGPVWHLYFDTDYLEYELIQPANVRKYSDFINLWVFINRDDANKVRSYMNKYVKDKVKELY